MAIKLLKSSVRIKGQRFSENKYFGGTTPFYLGMSHFEMLSRVNSNSGKSESNFNINMKDSINLMNFIIVPNNYPVK